jgi:hypothetical protein
MSDLPLALAVQSCDLSPATLRSRLVPFRVQTVLDMTIYEFRRGLRPTDASTCDMALLVFWSGKSVFRLQYYPRADTPQITRELPMQDLYVAVNDLAQAGFPVVRDVIAPRPPPTPKQASLKQLHVPVAQRIEQCGPNAPVEG